MKVVALRELLKGISSVEDQEELSAILLYRTNKAIKYLQSEKSGFAFKFYLLKRLYIDHFLERGFEVKNSIKDQYEEDKNMVTLKVRGTYLSFHMVKEKLGRTVTTRDISHINDEIKEYIMDSEKMYRMLLVLGEKLKIDKRYANP